MNCLSSSRSRPVGRGTVLVGALALMVVVLGACAADPADPVPGDEPVLGEDPMPTESRDSEEGPDGVLDQELALIGGDRAEILAVVEEYGGEVTVEIPETSTYQARFPVETTQELIALRDELRDRGFRAVLVTDFHPEGGAPAS